MPIATVGLDELITDMAALAQIPDSVLDGMLQAKADIIEPAQQQQGRAMGVHRTGVTVRSIKRTGTKKSKNGRSLEIYPQGKNNAEIAFINEYGTKKNRYIWARGKKKKANRGKMPARPFIDAANKANEQKATDAAAKVLDAFISSKNL